MEEYLKVAVSVQGLGSAQKTQKSINVMSGFRTNDDSINGRKHYFFLQFLDSLGIEKVGFWMKFFKIEKYTVTTDSCGKKIL